jgi:hypothetical protein
MRFPRKRGATSVMTVIFIPDNTGTKGEGLGTLTYASANLAISYRREKESTATEITGANILDITTLGTWLDPGAGKVRFKAVDAAKMKGLYELQFPDSAEFGTADTSQHIVVNVYEKTTTALNIGPNMVMIPLSKLNVLDGESDLVSILGSLLTETAGLIAAAFKKFFNVATPTGTVNDLPVSAATIAAGVRDVNNDSPAADSLGADVKRAAAASGSGAVDTTLIIREADHTIVPDCDVQIRATDDAAAAVVASGKTDDFGVVQPHPQLDAGTYYVWRQKAGIDFTSPEAITVS